MQLINPILRGWVNDFAVGHSSECFSCIKDGRKKIRPHMGRSRNRWASVGRRGVDAGCMTNWSCSVAIGFAAHRWRKSLQQDRSHNPCREADRKA
ncbi:group II intron maturase-specific domain-containing protein [Burkholderia cepacia]|uniref:group II intron maturase-specific domain-containing protein n=1 Tax=Burkholderia cepacia TaxID=292 RepID=UPI0009BDA846